MTKNSIKKIPRLRFKGFEGEWNRSKLRNLGTFQAGGDVDKNKLKSKGNYPVIANNLSNQGIIGYYDNTYKIDEPALTITGRGTVGVAKSRYYKFTPVVRLLVFKSKLDLKFSELSINNLNIFNESTGVPQLTSPQMGSYDILYPKLNEQEKIGSFFAKLDQLIDLQSKKVEQLKKLKRGYLQKMFPQKGESVPRLRFNGFSGEWKDNSLLNLGETFTGLSGKNKNDFGHGDAQYVTYKNVYLNTILSKNMNENVEIDDKQNKVQKGDIFFTTSSETPYEVGLSSVLTYNQSNLYLNSFTFGYRPNIKFNNYFIGYLLRSNGIRKKIYPLAQGISRYNLSKKSFIKMHIRYPSLSEQNAIGNLFKNISKDLLNQNNKLQYLKKLKKAYLQKIFC
ncbi:restriction endonuclease subunit S [Apilactobacillus micheneri]|uniref:Restriction endonuclease subunit S n=1 Tax=Apilactobacillus micheneri TaxID=1899430 RepID=A0ABY2YY16_9LACO|nr:restriction endonuclease subunit S [Apilactobacillus micheneri]TPR24478.1 restriction endonuclease subunit S [Apilactobacillus micheneri]TPR25789.1 restriction endonuclease subunit S [Apilactobacillus micheneri]TPR27979.1 restriction endonuclease subunit S [Apilactobacillus micheneri]TPR29470.1 restriction endonuclease subunit S [Apilactobacillus micheneri]TPR30256.1 restriction endonuclease subunit S [Apilactobacillus micheneri]